MGNLDIWDAIARPPKEALKEISGGRLKGMTDISPQWRLKAMTEQFGPVGMGWGYTIERLWTEPGSDGQVCAFAQVSVWYADSKPITGVGGSMLVVNEKNGPYTSDEAYKMAVTDALSVAMKALGMGAAIYMGMWDGSKYRDGAPEQAPADKATEMYTSLKKLLGEKKLDGALDDDAYAKAVKWLDGHARTVTGMTAAKKKLDERFAMTPDEEAGAAAAFDRADKELKEVGL